MIRQFAWLAVAVLVSGCAPKTEPGPKGELAWAYPIGKDTTWKAPAGDGPFTVPGSRLSFTKAQVSDDQNPVDWFPDEHPPAPGIVAHSPGQGLTPCAECHGYNGSGSVNTPDIRGLSAGYIVEQVHAFRDGDRRSAQADSNATGEMLAVARQVSDVDLAKAAAYFAALPRGANRRVVETNAVPVTTPDKYGWLDPVPNGGRETIGNRVIEINDDLPHSFMDDHDIGSVVYVPSGAIARGQALVASGGQDTSKGGGQPCTACHGADLKGAGDIPPLAGRSPAYLARMLWDIKTGARKGPSVALMQAPAKDLTAKEIVDITAYLASRQP